MNTRIGYDGDIYYTIVLNSFVHLVMYSYYQLTTLNIPVPQAIKKLVTNLQMIQFVTMNIQAVYILVLGCDYPRNVTIIYLVYILSLLFLFNDFSSKTYKKTDKADKPKKGDKKSN
jgi:elongation of very long chain fatty acids protein 4